MGTLSGLSPAATLDEILAVNESVNQKIQSALKTQMLLQSKLDSVIKTPVLTGPSGATGPLITANNARIINPAIVQVGDGNAVPLTFNSVINGTAISHTPGSTDITLAPNQTYYAFYEASTNLGFADQGTALLQLELNGTLLNGSQSEVNLSQTATSFPPAFTRLSLSSDAVFNTGSETNTLTLVNASGHAIDVEGANINIIKLQ
ncbi:hypothetical protein [Bacillus albus]|uniref:hypothetical protein n=1 Tax=Bacillus albus TaxID=2026189 RepID=UPI001F5C24F6|nr:hypothetical protein [Bacillus albus]